MNLPSHEHMVNDLFSMASLVRGEGRGHVDPLFFTGAQWEEFARMLRSYLEGLGAIPPAGPGTGSSPEVGDLVEVHWSVDEGWQLCEVLIVDHSPADPARWVATVFRVDGRSNCRLIRSGVSCQWRTTTVRRCLVRGCTNRSDQGVFRGNVCHLCASFLAGRGDRANSSQSYRNHVAFARETFLTVSGEVFDQLVDPRKL
jgi:hypothetical protein